MTITLLNDDELIKKRIAEKRDGYPFANWDMEHFKELMQAARADERQHCIAELEKLLERVSSEQQSPLKEGLSKDTIEAMRDNTIRYNYKIAVLAKLKEAPAKG